MGLTKGATETQSGLWTMVVAVVGETPSLTQKSIGKSARDKQGSCIVPSLAPPPQASRRVARP